MYLNDIKIQIIDKQVTKLLPRIH